MSVVLSHGGMDESPDMLQLNVNALQLTSSPLKLRECTGHITLSHVDVRTEQ